MKGLSKGMKGLSRVARFYDRFEQKLYCFGDADDASGGAEGDDFGMETGVGTSADPATGPGPGGDQDLGGAEPSHSPDDFDFGDPTNFGFPADAQEPTDEDFAEDNPGGGETEEGGRGISGRRSLIADDDDDTGEVTGSDEDLLGRVIFGPPNVRRPVLGRA